MISSSLILRAIFRVPLSTAQRLCALVQDLDISVVDVDSVALFAGDFPDDSDGLKVLHCFADGRWSQIELGSRIRDGCDRVLSQQVKHAVGRTAFSAEVLDLASVLVKQLQNLAGCVRRLLGGLLDSFQEEPQPASQSPLRRTASRRS